MNLKHGTAQGVLQLRQNFIAHFTCPGSQQSRYAVIFDASALVAGVQT
jgi:hypothetical protein